MFAPVWYRTRDCEWTALSTRPHSPSDNYYTLVDCNILLLNAKDIVFTVVESVQTASDHGSFALQKPKG